MENQSVMGLKIAHVLREPGIAPTFQYLQVITGRVKKVRKFYDQFSDDFSTYDGPGRDQYAEMTNEDF